MIGGPLHHLDLFFAKAKPLQYKKGEVIFRAGDQPPGIYYLASGYVRVYSFSRSGEELTLIIFRRGDIFPVSWALNAAVSAYFVEAMTKASLWRVSREEFLDYVRGQPEILFELTHRVMERFLGLMERMEHLVFGNAHSKVASILLICAERFGRRVGKETIIDVPLTHNDIATLVGLTRETVSIEMKKLEKRGCVGSRRRHLVVKNRRSLAREAQIDGV